MIKKIVSPVKHGESVQNLILEETLMNYKLVILHHKNNLKFRRVLIDNQKL